MDIDTEIKSKDDAISLPSLSLHALPLQNPDGKARKELTDLNQRGQELQNQNMAQNIKLRKVCAFATLIGVGIWLLIVGFIIVMQGFSFKSFNLTPAVLMMLLSTTTANVLGCLFIIYKYLFKSNVG